MRLPVFFSVVMVCSLAGQTSHVPYDPINGYPSFTDQQLDYTYKGFYTSIRAVDFRNFTFRAGVPGGPFTLKNGSYKHDDPYYHSAITLESVDYLGRPKSTQPQSALVMVSWLEGAGSSSGGGTALVFTVSNNRLRLTQAIGWDTHFQTKERTESFDPGTDTLVVRTAHYIPGDAHCCVSAMDVITLHWNGTRFAQTDFKTELSEYGKAEGKTLPP
jgi:hypothetical protein